MGNIFEWQRTSAESQKMKPEKLEQLWGALDIKETTSFMVIRNDRIVFERYAEGWDSKRKHYTASVAKAVTGGLSLMLSLDDGLIDLEDYAYKYIPQWKSDPLKSLITIRHLATHTSGLEDANIAGIEHMELPGWKGAFWRQEPNPFIISRDEAPVIFMPGTGFHYSNPGIAMLTYAVTASLKDSGKKDIRAQMLERIVKHIGISESEWSIGYGKSFETDGLMLVPSWGGGNVSPEALARFGRLMLNRGKWDESQLINAKIVRKSIFHAGCPSSYGLTWKVNSDLAGGKIWPSLPWDAFAAIGAGDQLLLVIPSREIIVVRYGEAFNPKKRDNNRNWDTEFEQFFCKPLMDSVESIVPCPWSNRITKMNWAPASSVLRLSTGGALRDGSDNWPMTWADDDNLYTAYGDGYGFAPQLPFKLGMGFARIKGMPEDFKCENIRSGSENTAYGVKGEKSSSLLMTDGVLYLWVRNADKQGSQSRLGYSYDYAKTWKCCDWVFEEFGHPVFINYGINYTGARDSYVYIVSHDSPSAYKEADRFVLMRVPKHRLTNRDSYEFFAGIRGRNKPFWASDINKREAIINHKNHCRRMSISYNAGIGRYLMWQQYTLEGTDTRYYGGVVILEAPEPWGPWSTVYFSEKWDIGPGDLGCFPTKWMSEDGKTIYLVFSGDDDFCVRKAMLEVDGNAQ